MKLRHKELCVLNFSCWLMERQVGFLEGSVTLALGFRMGVQMEERTRGGAGQLLAWTQKPVERALAIVKIS